MQYCVMFSDGPPFNEKFPRGPIRPSVIINYGSRAPEMDNYGSLYNRESDMTGRYRNTVRKMADSVLEWGSS